jgi:hypothetical protein
MHGAAGAQAYHPVMRLLEALASAFINTFGITQPSDRTRRRAAWFILGMLCLCLAAVAAIGFLLVRLIRG